MPTPVKEPTSLPGSAGLSLRVGDRPPVSVVIPALNEEELLAEAIGSVRADAEVIVVDGGSSDTTVAVAESAGARVIPGPRGRGAQLAAGAQVASGAWLVFLHADTRLEPGWAEALRGLDESVVGGAFRFAVDSKHPCYRWIEAGVRLRCALLRLPFGDQGIFARRGTFTLAGGFNPLPIMEDVDFVRRLGRVGRLAFPPIRAITSPRRWGERGLLATMLLNWALVGLYAAGYPRERLGRLYGGRSA